MFLAYNFFKISLPLFLGIWIIFHALYCFLLELIFLIEV